MAIRQAGHMPLDDGIHLHRELAYERQLRSSSKGRIQRRT